MGETYTRDRGDFFTDHCRQRMNQRGISRPVIEDVLQYGRELFWRGSVTYIVGSREVAFYAERGVDLRHCLNVHVVCSSHCGTVITTYVSQRIRRPRGQRYDHRRASAAAYGLPISHARVLGELEPAAQKKPTLS